MTTIYLSSTYEDLKEYRRIVFDALRKSKYTVIAMEDYVATDKRPVEKCLVDVARSDIYVGIFAFRYGYIPPSEHNNPAGLSITELELRHAERLEKPCLIFLVSEDAFWPRKFDDGRSGKGEQINRLRGYLQTEKMASFFASPHELASLVQAAMLRHLQQSQIEENKEAALASSAITWEIEEHGSPYPGLLHFTREYAPVFFGRDAEIRAILDLTYTPEGRFIIVSGSSGTGKSSLVDAGVLWQLEQAELPGDKRCRSLRMVPSQGSHPFDALMRVLHSYAERAGLDPYRLGDEMAAKPATFTDRIQKIIANGIDRDALVLFVDQMEELFTARDQNNDRVRPGAFLSALYRGAHETQLWVIATIRSDFLHHCHNHPDMLKVLRGPGHYPLGQVEPLIMDDMIVKPAQCAGLSISDTLVRRLIRDAGSEPGNLPLLAFVLERLFEQRQGNLLSEEVYKAIGGVEGAIADHIKTVEEPLTEKFGSKALDRLQQIFPSLLQVGVEGPPTRRRALWLEFASDLRPIVEFLVKKRLLSTEGEGDESTVSLVHEALIHSWNRLQTWLREDREILLWQQRLQALVDDWQRTRDKGMLLRGGPLVEAKRWRTERREKLTTYQKDFIRASQNRQIRGRLGIGSAVTVVLIVVSFFLWVTDNNMNVRLGLGIILCELKLYTLQPEMIEVLAGTFMMGSSNQPSPTADLLAREDEFKQHKVKFNH